MKKIILIVLTLVASMGISAATHISPLDERVAFWKAIYSQFDSSQVIFFDADDMSTVYHVAQIPSRIDDPKNILRRQIMKETHQDVRRAVEYLNEYKPKSARGLFGIIKQVYLRLESVDRRDKYALAHNIRYQTGLRDRFQEGYELSGIYDDDIKEILHLEGMPPELIAIPFVESLFYVPARSRSGAVGIWQFMRGTAKEFMCVNNLVDERYDPIIATNAAVDYLRDAYDKLGNWPLAITSYNYGRYGMMRAVNKIGSDDLEVIIRRYKHRNFGFAAKNYYAEVLAALEVYRNAESIFHESEPKEDWDFEMVMLPHAVFLKDLVRVGAVNKAWFLAHNPALTQRVCKNREVMPPKFSVRIPKGEKQAFLEKLKQISKKKKQNASRSIRAKHKANGRESIAQIAARYDIDAQKLAKRLGRPVNHRYRKGQVIILRSVDSHFSNMDDI